MQTGPLLRPMSVPELLDATFGLYRRQFAPLVLVSLATQAIPLALGAYVELAGGAVEHPGAWMASLLVGMVLGTIGMAASTFIVAETYLGGSITPADAFRRSTPFIGRLITAAVLSFLLYFFGLLLLIVPGIIALCGLSLVAPATVLENQPSATAGMSRSWQLTKGHRRRVLVAYIVAFLLIGLPTIALGVFSVAAASATGSAMLLGVATLLVGMALQVLAYPFLYVLTTLFYYDVRVRKEAYDLEMLSAALGTP